MSQNKNLDGHEKARWYTAAVPFRLKHSPLLNGGGRGKPAQKGSILNKNHSVHPLDGALSNELSELAMSDEKLEKMLENGKTTGGGSEEQEHSPDSVSTTRAQYYKQLQS